jgi:hypothetical protein
MHDGQSEALALLALVYVSKYCARGDLLPMARQSAKALFEAYIPQALEEVGQGWGEEKQGVGTERGPSVQDAAVRFFRFGGLALAELADVEVGRNPKP